MSGQMYVQCHTLDELMQVIASAVKDGLTFKADTNTLVVTFTGGY